MTWRLVVLSALLLTTAGYLRAASAPELVLPRESLSRLPTTLGSWTGAQAPDLDNEVLEVLGVDDYVTRVYEEAGAPVDARLPVGLYIGYYTSQRQGDTIHSPMNCLPGAGWQPVRTGTLALDVAGATRTVNRVVIQKGELRQVVLYWYQGRGRVVANEYWSKAYLVWDAATRRRSDGALVRVISPVATGETGDEAAERRVVSFAQALYPELPRFLPE